MKLIALSALAFLSVSPSYASVPGDAVAPSAPEAQAAPTLSTFVGSTVVIRQVLNKGLLNTHQYDATLQAALERSSDTFVGEISSCEPALGKFTCSIKVENDSETLNLKFSVYAGEISWAKIDL